MKIRLALATILGAAALGVGITACGSGGLGAFGGQGSFAGPPQGSAFGGGSVTPLIGASPFTFEPEIEQITGFAVDHWYLNPGADTNEAFNGFIPIGDGINALADAQFEQFTCGNCTGQSPQDEEVNFQFPISVSFVTQWFGRHADNSRPTTVDVFGRLQYSDSALDISLITGPTVEGRDPAGNLISITIDGNYPNRDLPGGAIQLPLKGWLSPPPGDPFAFPPSQQAFSSNQFNVLGLIRVRSVSSGLSGGSGAGSGGNAAGGNAALSIGAAIQDMPQNGNVETMLSIPATNMQGMAIAVQLPVGLFSDNYAESYRFAPVTQPPQGNPTAIPPIPPASLAEPKLEEALIEFSRHMAAACANLVGQAIGLSPSRTNTIMDPSLAIFLNGYQYRFDPQDVDQMATQSLPGALR